MLTTDSTSLEKKNATYQWWCPVSSPWRRPTQAPSGEMLAGDSKGTSAASVQISFAIGLRAHDDRQGTSERKGTGPHDRATGRP